MKKLTYFQIVWHYVQRRKNPLSDLKFERVQIDLCHMEVPLSGCPMGMKDGLNVSCRFQGGLGLTCPAFSPSVDHFLCALGLGT